MAVALVSTGVQFPDSTIQTTAASSGGMTLISTVSVPGSSSGVSVTGISSYKSIIITTVSVSLTASQRLYAALSTDNGASYSSAVQFTEYATPTYGFIQFFNTNTGANKPYLQVDRTGQDTNYVTVPSAGAVNAIQLSVGGFGAFFSSGTILIYGMS